MQTMTNAGAGTGTGTGTAANVRTWAGHRQAFPLGQSHTPLTSMPTLGRALTDGNLNEVGFVNSFLQHLAQQSGPVEDDSDEDAKYEEEDDDSRRDYAYDDDEDYYARNKKRRTRWRANYPKIKKTKRINDASSSSSSSARRRASVSIASGAYNSAAGSGVGGSGMKKRDQRSNSVSSYFAMRSENSSPTFQPSPSPSTLGCDYVMDPRLSSSPEDQHQHQEEEEETHPLSRSDFEQPEWMAAASVPSYGGGGGGFDLPAVPSPPPLAYPVGLPSIQPLYPSHHYQHHQQQHQHQQHQHAQHYHFQRSSSSPAVLPPSYSSVRGPAAEYYSPPYHHQQQQKQHQHHQHQQWMAHAASAAMPPPAPVTAVPTTTTTTTTPMDEEVEVLESSATLQTSQFDYGAPNAAIAPAPPMEDEGSWLEDLLRLEQPSSTADSSSFPSTPLSPSPNHPNHAGGQHQTASKDAFFAELFGY